jgi:4-amino-4-deoxy-L-arabinose transferase-like glycosyltransferase
MPDGVLTLVLIFPVVILGYRMAGAQPSAKQRKWRVATGLGLALCTLLAMAGTEVAMIPILVILAYGIGRGAQAMAQGQGKKRAAWGLAIILFTLFGVANYFASLDYRLQGPSLESSAVTNLLIINTAEMEFQTNATLHVNKNGVGEYGSLEQLHKAGLLDDVLWEHLHGPIYRYVVVLAGDPARDEQKYFVYAVPMHYGQAHLTLSLLRHLIPYVPYTRRTFASDETGVIRGTDLGGARDVTRAEAEKWPQI